MDFFDVWHIKTSADIIDWNKERSKRGLPTIEEDPSEPEISPSVVETDQTTQDHAHVDFSEFPDDPDDDPDGGGLEGSISRHPAKNRKNSRKSSIVTDFLALSRTHEELFTHLNQGNHSFSVEAIKNHFYPLQQKLLWLETRRSALSSEDIMILKESINNHLELLHVDAHENGPSSNGKEGSKFHVHFKD